jgi:hypothetical protein
MPWEEADAAAALARVELVELVDGDDEIAFRNLEPAFEPAVAATLPTNAIVSRAP